MNTTSLGKAAEDTAAEYLARQGFDVIDRNWRRRACEIDIVARKAKVIYIVEVKYRTKDGQGAGLDYITSQKVKQLHFASQMWSAENDWEGDVRILGISVRADELTPVVEQVVEID